MKEILTKELNELEPLGISMVNPRFAIYSTTIHQTPHIVLAIGKERAKAFSQAGVKTTSIDLDDYDACGQFPQSQMFVWDMEEKVIVGGYRYSYNYTIPATKSPMEKAFRFTDEFREKNWIHLGRSFISIDYQKNRYGILALMNGLGCIFARAKDPEGFFGKVTIPGYYETNGAADFIAAFCKYHWIDGESLGCVKKRYAKRVSSFADLAMSHVELNGDYKEFVNLLRKEYRMPGIPILKIYDSLSDGFKSIHYLGTFVHKEFDESTEIGMAIHRNNFSSSATKAHIEPYR